MLATNARESSTPTTRDGIPNGSNALPGIALSQVVEFARLLGERVGAATRPAGPLRTKPRKNFPNYTFFLAYHETVEDNLDDPETLFRSQKD